MKLILDKDYFIRKRQRTIVQSFKYLNLLTYIREKEKEHAFLLPEILADSF